jgi:hypothetical protein
MKEFLASFSEVSNIRYSGHNKTYYFKFNNIEYSLRTDELKSIQKVPKSLQKEIISLVIFQDAI